MHTPAGQREGKEIARPGSGFSSVGRSGAFRRGPAGQHSSRATTDSAFVFSGPAADQRNLKFSTTIVDKVDIRNFHPSILANNYAKSS
jgi:hypothetical protein